MGWQKRRTSKGVSLMRGFAVNPEHYKKIPLYCEAYGSPEKECVGSTSNVISFVIMKTCTHGNWAVGLNG